MREKEGWALRLRIACNEIDFEWIGEQLKLKGANAGTDLLNRMIGGVVKAMTPERLVFSYLKLNPDFIKKQLEKVLNQYGIRASLGNVECKKIEETYYLYAEIYWVDWESLLEAGTLQLGRVPEQMGVRSLVALLHVLVQPFSHMLDDHKLVEAMVGAVLREQNDVVRCLESMLTMEGKCRVRIQSIQATFPHSEQ